METAAEEGNKRAQLALDVFRYSVKKFIGAYAAAMGGVDAIVFTAGVGENDAGTRMDIASDLEFMGGRESGGWRKYRWLPESGRGYAVPGSCMIQ